MIKRIILILSLFIICSQPAFALSNKPGSDPTGKSQRQIIEQAPWFDPTDCDPTKTPEISAQTSSATSPGQTWFMGDSLTYGLKDFGGLEEKLKAKGFIPNKVNARGGRAILNAGGGGPGQDTGTGLEAVANDANFIRDSKNIIIALGTNDANGDASTFGANQDKLLNNIKALNPSAKIFWVDLAAVGNGNNYNKSGAQTVNISLYDNYRSKGYNIISQFKFVWGQDQDPKQLANKSLPDPTGLLSTDGIHYAGGLKYQEYADFLVNTLAAGEGIRASNTNNIPDLSGCKCVSGSSGNSTMLEGGDNIEKAFNFLIGKGLNSAQVAGIVGNLMAESNVDPTAKNDQNGGHHGIAQWDKTRYENLKKFAEERGVANPDELGIQLEFLWFELPNQRANRGIYSGKNFLEASENNNNDPEEAAVQFHDTFERSNNEGIPIRKMYALTVFQSFGSNNPSQAGNTIGQTGTGACGGTSSGSTIDPTLPQGTAAELFEKIKATGKVTNVEKLGIPGMKATILAVVLKLTEKYSFTISSTLRPNDREGSPHKNGSAVDLVNINGQGVPTGEDYNGFNQIAADFIKDAATLLPPGGSYIGVPNERFKAIEEPIITSKGGSTLIETRANSLADGAHFHLNVPASAP